VTNKKLVYELAAVRDPRSGQAVKQFSREILSEYAKIKKQTPGLGDQAKELAATARQAFSTARKTFRTFKDFEDAKVKVAEDAQRAIQETIAEGHKQGVATMENSLAISVEMSKAAAAEIEQINKRQTRFLNRESGLRTQKEIAEQRKQEAEGRRSLAKRLADFKKAKAEERRIAKKAADDMRRAEERAHAAAEADVSRRREFANSANEYFNRFDDQLGRALDGVGRVSRGFVALGLVGEDSLQELTDGLLTMQGAFDVISGGASVIMGMQKAMQAYAVATQFAAAAQQTLAATAPGGGGSRGRKGGSRRGGGSSAALTGAAAIAANQFVPAITGSGALAAAGATFTVGSAAALATSVFDSGRGYLDYASGRSRNVGVRSGSISDIFNRNIVNPAAGMFDEFTGNTDTAAAQARISSRKVAKMEEEVKAVIAQRLAIEEKINEQYEAREGILSKMRSFHETIMDLQLSEADNSEKRVLLAKHVHDYENRIAAVRERMDSLTDANEGQRASLLEREASLAGRLRDITKERFEVERDIIKEKAAGAAKAQQAAERELDTIKQRTKAARDSLLSSEVRFGLMSDEDQTEILGLLQKGRSGKRLDVDELRKLQGLGSKEATEIVNRQALARAGGLFQPQSAALESIERQRAKLQLEEARVLRGARGDFDEDGNRIGLRLGIRGSNALDGIAGRRQRLNAQEARIRAQMAGEQRLRDSVFGRERRELDALAGRQNKVEARIQHQISVQAKFDQTAEAIGDAMVERLMQQMQPFVNRIHSQMATHDEQIAGLLRVRRQTIPGQGGF